MITVYLRDKSLNTFIILHKDLIYFKNSPKHFKILCMVPVFNLKTYATQSKKTKQNKIQVL